MEKITLHDFYKSRQRTETAFTTECTKLLSMLKERYQGIRLMSITLSPLRVYTKRKSMLYYVIVLFNMKSRQSVFLRIQCDGTLYCTLYKNVPLRYQSALELLQPRFQENYTDVAETQVSLKRSIISQEYPFEKQLQIERPIVLQAS